MLKRHVISDSVVKSPGYSIGNTSGRRGHNTSTAKLGKNRKGARRPMTYPILANTTNASSGSSNKNCRPPTAWKLIVSWNSRQSCAIYSSYELGLDVSWTASATAVSGSTIIVMFSKPGRSTSRSGSRYWSVANFAFSVLLQHNEGKLSWCVIAMLSCSLQ